MKTKFIKAVLATLLLFVGLNKAAASMDPSNNRAEKISQTAAGIPCTLPCVDPDLQ